MFLGAYQLYAIELKYKQEEESHSKLLAYKPSSVDVEDKPQGGAWKDVNAVEQPSAQSKAWLEAGKMIADAKVALNDEIIGWITLPDTGVDYPFVQGEDNSFYLNHDAEKKKSSVGAIFADMRSNPDFLDFNTILYGHHMKNGSMFGELLNFTNKIFFDSNPTGWIYLENKVIRMDIFACLVIHPSNEKIYGTFTPKMEDRQSYLNYIKQNARNYRDIGVTSEDRVVTLSTCSYDFEDARMVVIAKLVNVL
jgi:sortase B